MFKENILFDLINKRNELLLDIQRIDARLLNYREGTLQVQNKSFYIKYYKQGKVISNYVGRNLTEEQIANIKRELENHKTLVRRKKDLIKEKTEIEKMIRKYGGVLWI